MNPEMGVMQQRKQIYGARTKNRGNWVKNVLFLTLSSIEDINQRGLYTDLIRAIAGRGHNVYAVVPRERRTGLPTELASYGSVHVLKTEIGNITKVGVLEKGISTLTIERDYEKAIKRHLPGITFDMVVYSTPPITFERLVKQLKKTHGANTYLILKDIFPQNAVDIGFMKKNSLLWRYFRRRERVLYQLSDMIGCMSPANVKYVLDHNPDIDAAKLEVFPNAIQPRPRVAERPGRTILNRYGVPEDATLFVYGGNLGKPQGIDFLLEVIDNFHQVENSFLMIVGSGTEYGRIQEHVRSTQPVNVALHDILPKAEYDELLRSADVGLIFLDSRFTIPNFPSRLTAYMESSIPVLAATDVSTDLKDVLIESRSGFWCMSGDLDAFLSNAKRLAQDEVLRLEMGSQGREYLEEHYDVTKTVEILLKHL